MTTCTPDYLHEDLIDCERRGITGEVCERWFPLTHIFMPERCDTVPDEEARTRRRRDGAGLRVTLWGWASPPHPADFPRCEVRL